MKKSEKLLKESLNAMTELISKWSQLNDDEKLNFLKTKRDEIRKEIEKK